MQFKSTLEEALKSVDEKSDEKQNDVVCQRHFDEALERVKPRLNSSLLSFMTNSGHQEILPKIDFEYT